jgi:hypothetical protein
MTDTTTFDGLAHRPDHPGPRPGGDARTRRGNARAKPKVAELGQRGSELGLEYERHLGEATASVPDDVSDGLRELVDALSGYRDFCDSFLEVSGHLSAWTDCQGDDPPWLAEHRRERREARLDSVS